MRTFLLIWVAIIFGQLLFADSPVLPVEVDESGFSELLEESPFLRLVGGSNSLILTGIAVIDDKVIATLIDSETQLTHLVSEGEVNKEGWQLVSIKGDRSNLASVLVQVQRAAGDVVPVRYDKAPPRPLARKTSTKTKLSESQLKEIAAAVKDPKKGIRGDGLGNSDMTPEFVGKLNRLSETQRGNLLRQVMDLRNQGVSTTRRAEIYRREVDNALKRR